MKEFFMVLKDFFVTYWPLMLMGLGGFSAVCMALGKYMESNDVNWDDGAGRFLKWLGGLGNAMLGALGSIVSSTKNTKGLPVMILFCLLAGLVPLQGCAERKSLTQQIMAQTDDIEVIALATYADALQLYVNVQETYIPYQATLRAEHPEIDRKIVDDFSRAWEILKRWKALRSVPGSDVEAFRDCLRAVSLEIIQNSEL